MAHSSPFLWLTGVWANTPSLCENLKTCRPLIMLHLCRCDRDTRCARKRIRIRKFKTTNTTALNHHQWASQIHSYWLNHMWCSVSSLSLPCQKLLFSLSHTHTLKHTPSLNDKKDTGWHSTSVFPISSISTVLLIPRQSYKPPFLTFCWKTSYSLYIAGGWEEIHKAFWLFCLENKACGFSGILKWKCMRYELSCLWY